MDKLEASMWVILIVTCIATFIVYIKTESLGYAFVLAIIGTVISGLLASKRKGEGTW